MYQSRVKTRIDLIKLSRRLKFYFTYFFFFIFVETQRDKQEAGSILMATTGSLIKIDQKEIALHARGREPTTTLLFYHFTFAREQEEEEKGVIRRWHFD